MVNSSILDLARQGDPEAIAKLMNQSLRAKQITVVVSAIDDCLTILASGSEPPSRTFLVNFVREGMAKLKIDRIRRVRIRSFKKGEKAPSWQEVVAIDRGSSHISDRISNGTFSPDSNGDRPIPQAPITPPVRVSKSTKTAKDSAKIPKTKSPPKPNPFFDRIKAFLLACLFVIVLVVSIGLAVGCRIFTAILAENYLYKVEILGDLLRGLETGELLNILVFAILGMGVGVATALVPKPIGHRIGAAVLIVALPVIFSLGSFIRYQGWIDTVSLEEGITRDRAVQITSDHLEKHVGNPGFLGFYLYTAQYPILPVRSAEMQEASDVKDLVNLRITNSIEKVASIKPKTVSTLFAFCIWSIRLFYFVVSVVTAIFHFYQGEALADKLAKRVPSAATRN